MNHLLDEPHHDPSPAYCGSDTPQLGDEVPVRLWVPHAHRANRVVLRTPVDGEPVNRPARQDGEDATGTWWAAEVPVANTVTSYRFLVEGVDGAYGWVNGSGRHGRDVTDAHDFTLLAESPPAPAWAQDAIVYQVFPDRFGRSAAADVRGVPSWAAPAGWDDPVVSKGPLTGTQWYGGDLAGIEEHLDHLVDLGASVLYMTPFFEGRSNHRYDAVSFDRVDPVLGGDGALVALVRSAHARGLRVLGDLTANHTGSGHEWFQAARHDPDGVEAGFYRFGAHPDEYASWLGVRSLPKLDYTSPELRRRMYGGPASAVGRYLAEPFGLDGWRIDVANMTGRLGADDFAHEVARGIRATMTGLRPDSWLVAEHGHDAGPDLAASGWHGTMNYSGFTRPVWAWLTTPGHGLTWLGLPGEIPSLPGPAVAATMRDFAASTPWAAWTRSMTILDSHDTPRFRTVVGGRERHLVGAALLATMPGAPMIFAGDEIGLTGVDGEDSRTPFPWRHRDRWDTATLDGYRALLRLRRDHVALRRGGLRWVHAGADSMTFLREHPDERLLVHVARADHDAVRLPLAALGTRRASALYGDAPVSEDLATVELPPRGPAAHVYHLD